MTEVRRILLVEDNARDVELTLVALEEHRLANDVVVVRDGAEALDYLNCEGRFQKRPVGSPVVVLLDLKMPKVDGLEVLRRMKASAYLRTVPVVMLTCSREEPDLIESYRLGVNAYIVKPVAFEDLMNSIKSLGLFWAVLNEPPPGTVHRAA